MKTKKLKKKSGTNFAIEIIEEQERRKKREKDGRRYGWGKIKNKSGKRK